MSRVLYIWTVWFLAAIWSRPAWGCSRPVSEVDLKALIAGAQTSFSQLDAAGFQADVDQISSLLPCVETGLSPEIIASYHQLQGFRAFVSRDVERSRAALTAARRTLPGISLPPGLLPETHPLSIAWAAIALDSIPTTPLPDVRGRLLLDGSPAVERPSTVPTLLQWEDAKGQIRLTSYLWPEEPLPAMLLPDPRRPFRAPLAITAGLGAVATGLLYYGASQSADQFWDPATPNAELPGLQQRVNLLTGGMIGAGGLGLAAGVSLLAISLRW